MALDVRLIFTTASRIILARRLYYKATRPRVSSAKLIDSFFADPGIFIGLKLPVAGLAHEGLAQLLNIVWH
jgi:hypothetical protein